MTKGKKSKSHRMTLHQKYKVQKKIKEATRKERKAVALGGGKKLKKDPGVPNLWPLKEQFIQKMQNQKAKLDDEKARQKENRKATLKEKRAEASKPVGMEGLVAGASAAANLFDKKQKKKADENGYSTNLPSNLQFKDGSKKAYFREFKKIVETADVILEVLDARDPLGCRCLDVEQKILAKDANKKIILVLNKIDLIPKDNVEQWLKHLRNEYPTIAFKCSTQSQKKNLGQSASSAKGASEHALESSECLGAETLLQLLKNYSRNLNLKTSVVVGIIGYPNVGKSSLINSLKRTRAVGVGATPGFTKAVQEIHLDKHIKLLDCPGIVFGNTTNSDNDIILRNCVKVEQIPDPIEPVETILKRAKKQQLLDIYKLADYNTVKEFLIQVAHKRGKMLKGGVIDINGAARSILQDWNAGKIPFFTVPPAPKKSVHLSSSIVTTWGKEFDIDSILAQEQSDLSGLTTDHSNHMAMEPGTADAAMDEEMEDDEEEEEIITEDEDDDDEMDDVDEPEMDPQILMAKSKKTNEPITLIGGRRKKTLLDADEEAVNPQVNKNKKANLKKLKKDARKGRSSGDSYDFGEYFGGNDDDEEDDDDIKLDDI